MIAKHFGRKAVGKFFYFINNLHIYDNQFEQAEELLLSRAIWLPTALGPEYQTDFFDIKPEDFELVDYDPVKPLLKFDLRFSDKSRFFDALPMGEILSELNNF